jgi:hypothetical protein
MKIFLEAYKKLDLTLAEGGQYISRDIFMSFNNFI